MTHLLPLIGLLALGAPSKGDVLLRQVEANARNLQGFTGNLTAIRIYTSAKPETPPYRGVETLNVSFLRPNFFRFRSKTTMGMSESVSDGKNLYTSYGKQYFRSDIDPTASDFHWYHDDLLQFYAKGSFAKAVEAPRPPVVTELPSAVWNGETYRILEAKVGGGFPISYRLFVGKDLLVHRIIHTEPNFGRKNTIDSSIDTLVANPPSKQTDYVFKPAADQKLESGDYPLRPGEYKLVEPGAVATDFSLPTPQGGRLTLKDAMKGSKAVLLNFWFIHCPPCRAEHPHLQRLYDEFKPKGLALIAIDDQDTAAQSAKYLKGANLTFPVVLTGPRFRTDPKTGQIDYTGPSLPDYASLAPYGVHSCPTNILIDAKTGKVAWLSGGWDEPALRKALKDLGIG